jgi:hypothetical protein
LHRREAWLFDLIAKILQKPPPSTSRELENDTVAPWLNLLDSTSASMLRKNYENGRIPAFAKVDMYNYKMAAPLWTILNDYYDTTNFWRPYYDEPSSSSSSSVAAAAAAATTGGVVWWNRTYEESLIPIVKYDRYQQRLVQAPNHYQ